MLGLFKKKPEVTVVKQPLDPSLIVPRIKHTNFLAIARDKIKNEDSLPATEPLVADLLVTYAFDLPETFQMVRVMDVRQMGLSQEQLRTTAVANLKRQIGDFRYTGNPPLLKMAVGNDLNACVLLVDEFWAGLAGKIPPEIVVGVPTRDVLLVTTSSSTKGGVQMLRDAVKEAQTGDNTHWLTKHLLVRRADKWEVFDAAA
ncbi:MAG: DUF1444 family protein [Verrucomicrobia bacterium]|nr:DUF1444 family protein [Verrucomicrobiota bacterium]